MKKKRILITAVLLIAFAVLAAVIWKKPWSWGASGQEPDPASSESTAEPSGTETESGQESGKTDEESGSGEDSPEEGMEIEDGDVYEVEDSEGETGELI